METIKLCKDCKWLWLNSTTCAHESAKRIDVVTGEELNSYQAEINRQYDDELSCGLEAKFFEPIEVLNE